MAYKNYKQVNNEPIDYTGKRFGRLTVIKRDEDAINKNGNTLLDIYANVIVVMKKSSERRILQKVQ